MTIDKLPLSYIAPPASAANPYAARVIAFTIGTTNVDKSIAFYRDLMGYRLLVEGSTPYGRSAFLRPDKIGNGGIRLIGLPQSARANRPRPDARAWDAGLAAMECRTADADHSHALLTNAGTRTLSKPLYYFFRDIAPVPDLDVRSYAAFGPGGEQLFITANVRENRPEWDFPGALHGPLAAAILVGIDAEPINTFYRQAFGLLRTSEMGCAQAAANMIVGAPSETTFRWGFLGERVSIEVESFVMPESISHPTYVERSGLAMMTMEVNDLAACRDRCSAHGIETVDQPVLALESAPREGFVIRGAVGELIEVVAA